MTDSPTGQEAFRGFRVPDQVRVVKARSWLEKNGCLEDNPGLSVLEIGYAKGGFLDNLGEYPNLAKYAVDINDRDCDADIVFHRHDCNNGLPSFEGRTFDIVFAGEVIEHIFDDASFLRSIYSSMKPGGVLCLTTPNLFFLLSRLATPFGRMPYFAHAPYHYHFYSVHSISKLVEDCGFSVKAVKSSHILFSSRRAKGAGHLFEFLGDVFPKFGAHIIIFAAKQTVEEQE